MIIILYWTFNLQLDGKRMRIIRIEVLISPPKSNTTALQLMLLSRLRGELNIFYKK